MALAGSTPVPISELATALHLGERNVVSLVGGGGKTTALFALGQQLGGTTILTTTTKMGSKRHGGWPVMVGATDAELVSAVAKEGVVLAWAEVTDRLARGVAPEVCDRWSTMFDHVVVEADGSRQRPFKAPESWEPVVPTSTTTLVACLGAQALGRPINEACHRPDVVARLAACEVDDALTPARAATVLLHAEGSRKGQPKNAEFAVAICQVPPDHPSSHELIELLDNRVPTVLIAAHSKGKVLCNGT